MSIDNPIDIQDSQEFIAVLLNFLDIKANKPPNEKINTLLNEIFEILNNQPKASKKNLENRFVEKLSFELLKLDKKDSINKLDQNYQKSEIKLKPSNKVENDFSKNEFIQDQTYLANSLKTNKNQNAKDPEKKIAFEKLNAQFSQKLEGFDKKLNITQNKLENILNTVKKTLENFKKEQKCLSNEKVLDNSTNLNKLSFELTEKVLKLNFKLFSVNNLKFIAEQAAFIKDKLDQIPLGIVGYHIKEKDKKNYLKKSKKKKKYLYSKQMKYKKENHE